MSGSSAFFSSRRRHTRYWRDWSSDVCSSDLPPFVLGSFLPGSLREKGIFILASWSTNRKLARQDSNATVEWLIATRLCPSMNRSGNYHCTSSTRRFFARPSSASLDATGEYMPHPKASSRLAPIPYLLLSSATTLLARR